MSGLIAPCPAPPRPLAGQLPLSDMVCTTSEPRIPHPGGGCGGGGEGGGATQSGKGNQLRSDRLRDWSLITGRGYKTGGVGAIKVLLLQKEKKGGGRKKFSHAEGGGGHNKKFWGSFNTGARSLSHSDKGAQKVSAL